MSDTQPTGPIDPTANLLARASGDAATVRQAAFARLRTGTAVSMALLAADTGLPPVRIDAALGELVDTGTVTLDQQLGVVAAGGLSLTPTAHQLHLNGVDLWTWCAFDAIGIPAALGVDAAAHTRCGHCNQPVEVTIRRGLPPTGSRYVGWLSGQPCGNVQQDFCPQANLFCNLGK